MLALVGRYLPVPRTRVIWTDFILDWSELALLDDPDISWMEEVPVDPIKAKDGQQVFLRPYVAK